MLLNVAFTQTIKTDSIWFEKSNSFRKYKVWLPETYDTSKTYQTIYCLDADLLFNSLVSNVEIYSYEEIAKLPPTIVVGFYFDQRNDDMGILWDSGTLNETGIALKELIKNQLIPKIESNFPVSNYRSIVGHSNSSSFIQFFLWEKNPAFQGYLSMSEFAFEDDSKHFCGLTPETETDFIFVSGKKDAEFRYNSGLKHEAILDSCSIPNFNYEHIILGNADHITMVPQGIPLGLESLYSHYSNNISDFDSLFKMMGEQAPIDFMNRIVNKKAAKYGIEANYSFEEMTQLYDLYVRQKDSVNVRNATKIYAKIYNDSSEYFYEAQHLEMMKAYHSAEAAYLHHLSYYPHPGAWSYKRIIWLYMSKRKDLDKALHWCKQGYLALHENDCIDLIIKIAEKDKAYRSKAKKLLKELISEDETSYVKSKLDAL
jgi:hypothetical protein